MKGFEAAKTQLAALQTQANKITSGLSNIGGAFRTGFAAASAGIFGLVKAADPVRFTIFTQKLEILAIYIGLNFIPILKQAIVWVDKLIDYFKNLSDQQKDGITHWSKVGLVVLGVGSAIATAAGFISKIISLFGSLWEVISGAYGIIRPLVKALGELLPVGRIIKLLTLAFLLFRGEGERVGGTFGKLKDMMLPVLEKAWEIIKKVIDVIGRFAGMVGGVVNNIFGALGSGLLDIFEEAMPLIEKALNVILDILNAIGKAVDWVMDTVKDAQAIYKVLSEKKLSELPKAVAQGVGRSVTDAAGSLAKKLNPFDFLDDTIDSVTDFVKDDVIGGKEDETKMVAEREKLDEKPYEGGDYGGNDDDKKKTRDAPLRGFNRVETFGVEDAFKRAQQGASFDPSKLAEEERKKLQMEGNSYLEEIVNNTRKAPKAEETF